MSMNESNGDRLAQEDKIIMRTYAALAASLLLTFVPSATFAAIAMFLFCGVMIAAYILRGKAEKNSLIENHMTYIIRTIWIGSFFAGIFIGIGSVYLISVMDVSSMMSCGQEMMDAGAAAMSNSELMEIMEPCMKVFLKDNWGAILMVTLFCGGPVIVYFVYRLAGGMNRALKGHRIGNVKSWF